MEKSVFTSCIEQTDDDGVCGLPAEVREYYSQPYDDGILGVVAIRCLAGHILRCPIDKFPDASKLLMDIARSNLVEND